MREAVAAVRAARETDREVWVSWTLKGGWPDHLPSRETVAEAYAAVSDLGPDACLVNCCGANLVTRAIPVLARLTDRPVGGYANSADAELRARNPEPSRLERVPHQPLDAEGYARAAARWIDAGARIVGGCCSTRPEHISRLRALCG